MCLEMVVSSTPVDEEFAPVVNISYSELVDVDQCREDHAHEGTTIWCQWPIQNQMGPEDPFIQNNFEERLSVENGDVSLPTTIHK